MQQFSDDFYEGRVFRAVALEAGRLRGVAFEGCSFVQCAFSEAVFQACRFQDCTFRKCSLGLLRVEGSHFSGAAFEDCKLIGIDWTKAAWGRLLKPPAFRGCVLDYSSFAGLNLSRVVLRKCSARQVDFSGTDLEQADCCFTDFLGSAFQRTNLAQADLRGATGYSIHPGMNTLKKARFSLPEALSLLHSLEIEIADAEEGEG